MQRPSVTPVIEPRRQRNWIEARRHITDNPEDQPERRPRHTDDHRNILARQTQRYHTHVIDHPIDREGAVPVCGSRVRDFGVWCCWSGEWDLEGEGDERVEEREEEVGCNSCYPAPDNQLVEVYGSVALGLNKLHVDGKVEGETEERDDD